MVVVITFGTFDLLHIGHINMLKNCKKYGDKLIVGVSSDKLNYDKKKRNPVFKEEDRLEIIKNIKCVDEVFFRRKFRTKKRLYKKIQC
jgi:cytidyltransferase-like protein